MKKKVFFIHVAKTAGSSFNSFLQSNFKGEIHCEKYLEQDRYTLSNIDYLKSLDYISGHLKIPVFSKNDFSKNDYFLLAFLRNPVNQFLSHINWLVKISTMGEEFFMTHSQRFRDISVELREADLYDPDVFVSAMVKFQGIFKNNQSVYFVSDPMEVVSHAPSKSSSEIIEAMQVLDLVGITEYYQDSLETFAVLNNIDVDIKIDRDNQNLKYKLGKDILENPLINEFIQEYNQIDIEVYNHFLANYQSKFGEQQLCK